MLTKNIKFKNFINLSRKASINNHKDLLLNFIKKNSKILSSFSKDYKYNYNKKLINKYKNFSNYVIIGMGGSILGSKAIYHFLNHKIKKNFFFFWQFRK